MAKKPRKEMPAAPAQEKAVNAVQQTATGKLSLNSFRIQAIILAITGLVFYANTFLHESAFDDRMAITSNEYVQRGISGIPDILTHDAYQSYLELRSGSNQLAGGRYRPLSLITFAVEQQFMGVDEDGGTNITDAKEARIGQQMHSRHVINVMLYILSVIVLLYFFRTVVFKGREFVAFLAAMIFLMLPVHTEVVANVKSRDEILSVLFITLTFIKAFRYRDGKKTKDLVWALVCFFLALLSKEYAITLIALLPLSFYIFIKEGISSSAKAFLPYLIPVALYFLLRFSAVTGMAEGAEQNIMNNPYLYATGAQRIASEILVLLNYVRLLVFPYPLAADYSYNQLPYADLSNLMVWVSLLVHIALAAATVVFVRRKHLLGFALTVYLLNLLLVSNLLFNIGAPMGERLIYHSSIGFAIAVAYLLYAGLEKAIPASALQRALGAFILILIIPCGLKTIDRNADWKDDNTLFLKDVKTVPNSILVNNNAAAACMSNAKKATDKEGRNKWFEQAVGYYSKAISMHPTYTLARLNRGLCYFNMGYPDKAFPDWDSVRKMEPAQPKLRNYLSVLGKYYFNQGMRCGKENKADSAVIAFSKGTLVAPDVPDMWYNLGNAYVTAGKYAEAQGALEKAIQLAPGNVSAKQLYDRVRGMQGVK